MSSRRPSGDPNPGDPLRGLYISDEQALALAADGGAENADARLADAAARLGLDALDTAVLGLAAAPELDPRYGRLFAYLHDDVTRRLASPRLVANLLAGDGVSAHRHPRLLPQRRPAEAPRRDPLHRGRRHRPARRPPRQARRPARRVPARARARRSTRSSGGRLRRQPIPTTHPGPRGDGRGAAPPARHRLAAAARRRRAPTPTRWSRCAAEPAAAAVRRARALQARA